MVDIIDPDDERTVQMIYLERKKKEKKNCCDDKFAFQIKHIPIHKRLESYTLLKLGNYGLGGGL